MKKLILLVNTFLCLTHSFSQSAITAVVTITSNASSIYTYSNSGNTYNWGVGPNNTVETFTGFTVGGVSFTYASALKGNVKLRRVDNAKITGNFSLVWAETVTNGTIFNMFPEYQNDMEPFFNNRVYNKGTDNLFDNTSANCNNIERLDWILNSPFSTPVPSQLGFAVFERGAAGAHDPFCIAAITSVDGLGNPATYSNILRVATASYGELGPSLNYRILKAQYPTDLLDASANTQNRGGVFITFQSLGIVANQTIYGYSLLANDLPGGATPSNLVDFTNATYFPTNTGNAGRIDLLAITGISISITELPTRFISLFGAVNNNIVSLG